MHLLTARGIRSFSTVCGKGLFEFLYRPRLPEGIVIIAAEHLEECPLRPFVIFRITGPDLPRPVVRKADPVQLLPVSGYVLRRSDGRMLSRLDGILFRRQAEGIISHGMQDIEPAQSLVAAEYVARYIAERMAHMKPRPRRIWEHVQYVIFRFRWILHRLECLMVSPV